MNLFGFIDFRFVDFLDVLLMAILLYSIYKVANGTVGMNILVGIVIIYIIWQLTNFLDMKLLSSVFGKFIGVGFFALIVVFQEEIRRFLLLLGVSSISKRKGFEQWTNMFKSERTPLNIGVIIEACQLLSVEKTGVLIVLERRTPLDFIKNTGDKMELGIDIEVFKMIFNKNSPLHDGAVVITHNRITATRVILPVTTNSRMPSKYGLRHRSAIGITERTDALAIVVSEETGKISYIKDGKFINFKSEIALNRMISKDVHY